MTNFGKIAEKFLARRVTFASMRPPPPDDEEELTTFCRNYLPIEGMFCALLVAAIFFPLGILTVIVLAIYG
jgi:hypothetical protein